MKRSMMALLVGLGLAVPATPASGLDTCLRGDDACVSVQDGTASGSVDIGAIDAHANAGPGGGGATADVGAVDAQTGTDRETCADAGSVNYPPGQQSCP